MTNNKSKDPLGTLLEGIERLAQIAEHLQQKAQTFSKEGEVDLSALKEGLKAHYRISFQRASSSPLRSYRSSFGSAAPKSSASRPSSSFATPKVLEPEVDLFVEDAAIKIYVQLPGVQENNIRLTLHDDVLKLEAKSAAQTFYKEILLPKPVQPESLMKSLRNGVLEITLVLAV